MANYSQSVFFGPKDSLLSGDPAKVVKGSEFDSELGLISTAISSKEDSSNKGIANGYASLDASTLVPVAQIPDLSTAKLTSGTLGVARGGTGVATVTAGNLLLGAGTSAMTSLAPGTARQVCISSGTAWTSRVLEAADIPNLSADKITSGTLPVSRGGTGLTSLTAGSVLVGNGTTTNLVAPSTVGNILRSDGSAWYSASLAVAGIAAAARNITAGNGLTGGGDLSSDRTLTMGTPGSLTSATTNAVTSTSHTHAIGGGIVKAHNSAGGQVTVSTLDPSGGNNGDIWFKVS